MKIQNENTGFEKTETMYTTIKRLLKEIDDKPISDEKKTIEAKAMMTKEWHMVTKECKTKLVFYPSYINGKHIVIFLAEAQPFIKEYLQRKILECGFIKCSYEITLQFTNDVTNMENEQTVTTGTLEYTDVSELWGCVNELCSLYRHHITQHCLSEVGCETFEAIKSFTINIL